MKKSISIIIAIAIFLAALLPVHVYAASASASLSGPGTVRAGDTITLSFKVSGSGIFGVSGALAYDGGQVSLVGTSQKIGSGWLVEFNGNNFVAYDNNLTNPISGSSTIFTATFKVGSVAPGTQISISCQGVKASDGSSDANVGTVSYSATIAEPLSGDNNLGSLSVSNATIKPAFSAGTTSYTAEVPYEISKLDLVVSAAHGKATVAVNNPTLTPDATTKVEITVTAENGAAKTYTIAVKRAQDPNYKPSSNNKLSDIVVEGFLLSPVFSADITNYVVWLPYETESIQIKGVAADKKAKVRVEGGDALLAGQDNPVIVICTAENGDVKEYTVIVKRAAAHDGSVDALPEETEPVTEPTTVPTTEPTTVPTTEPPTEPTEPVQAVPDPRHENCVPWWWLIVMGVWALAVGLLSGALLKSRKKK